MTWRTTASSLTSHLHGSSQFWGFLIPSTWMFNSHTSFNRIKIQSSSFSSFLSNWNPCQGGHLTQGHQNSPGLLAEKVRRHLSPTSFHSALPCNVSQCHSVLSIWNGSQVRPLTLQAVVATHPQLKPMLDLNVAGQELPGSPTSFALPLWVLSWRPRTTLRSSCLLPPLYWAAFSPRSFV